MMGKQATPVSNAVSSYHDNTLMECISVIGNVAGSPEEGRVYVPQWRPWYKFCRAQPWPHDYSYTVAGGVGYDVKKLSESILVTKEFLKKYALGERRIQHICVLTRGGEGGESGRVRCKKSTVGIKRRKRERAFKNVEYMYSFYSRLTSKGLTHLRSYGSI